MIPNLRAISARTSASDRPRRRLSDARAIRPSEKRRRPARRTISAPVRNRGSPLRTKNSGGAVRVAPPVFRVTALLPSRKTGRPSISVRAIMPPPTDLAVKASRLPRFREELGPHGVRMVRSREPGDAEADVEALARREGQGPGEPGVGERPAEQARGERQVDPLLPVGRGVGAVRIEGEDRGRRLVAEEGADEPGDVVGPGGVGARRAAHDRPEDVVEDADEFHRLPLSRRPARPRPGPRRRCPRT